MGRTNYRQYISTAVVPTTGVISTKTILVKPEGDETTQQRHKRMDRQVAANRGRVVKHEGNTYTVTSSQRGSDGKPVTTYDVVDMGNGMYLCGCAFGVHQPGVECSHIARTIEYQKRHDITPKVVGKSVSEQVTEAYIARSKAQRQARRTEWEEEV